MERSNRKPLLHMSGVKQFVFSRTPLLRTHIITNTNSPSGGCPQLQESTVPSYVIRIKKLFVHICLKVMQHAVLLTPSLSLI